MAESRTHLQKNHTHGVQCSFCSVGYFIANLHSKQKAILTPRTVAEAKQLHARAERPNLFIEIPGNREGVPAIEEAIFEGIPVNVTLLFSCEQYLAAAEAYMRGIERPSRPGVWSVASVFISRWDKAVLDSVRLAGLALRLGR